MQLWHGGKNKYIKTTQNYLCIFYFWFLWCIQCMNFIITCRTDNKKIHIEYGKTLHVVLASSSHWCVAVQKAIQERRPSPKDLMFFFLNCGHVLPCFQIWLFWMNSTIASRCKRTATCLNNFLPFVWTGQSFCSRASEHCLVIRGSSYLGLRPTAAVSNASHVSGWCYSHLLMSVLPDLVSRIGDR